MSQYLKPDDREAWRLAKAPAIVAVATLVAVLPIGTVRAAGKSELQACVRNCCAALAQLDCLVPGPQAATACVATVQACLNTGFRGGGCPVNVNRFIDICGADPSATLDHLTFCLTATCGLPP